MKKWKLLLFDPYSPVNPNIPNIGMAFAATVLDARVIDEHILTYPRNRFLKEEAETLGISVRSFSSLSAERARDAYRERYPLASIVSVTGMIDVQCCYPYLSWKNNLTVDVPFSDEMPFPEYERFDSFNYLSSNWQTGFWSYPLMSSHGCPYQCLFCASRARTWRPRSADHCVEELRRAKKNYGIRSFEVIDDAFNIDRERVLEFCEKVAPLGLSWACTNGIRADRFDEEQAEAMSKAGCVHVGFGMETTDSVILSSMKKGERFKDIERAVDSAVRHFSRVSGFFIIGLPGSTKEKDMASLRWAYGKGIRAHFSYFVPEVKGSTSPVFYGHASRPLSGAYSAKDQENVYRAALRQRRALYKKEGTVAAVLRYTLQGLRRWNHRSRVTHFTQLVKKGYGLLVRNDIS